MICLNEDCNRESSKRKMCEMHYRRWWRRENKEHVERYNKQYHKSNRLRPLTDILKYCSKCNIDFTPSGNNQKYCSSRCQNTSTHRRKRHTDINFKIKHNIRSRLRKSIKNKDTSFSEYIGSTVEELRTYLESKFTEGMTWENYGLHGWHIDHIRPLASFNLKNKEELLEACHYSNLQPLWAKDNLRKGDKVDGTNRVDK